MSLAVALIQLLPQYVYRFSGAVKYSTADVYYVIYKELASCFLWDTVSLLAMFTFSAPVWPFPCTHMPPGSLE